MKRAIFVWTEEKVVEIISNTWKMENKIVTKELVIPVKGINNIYLEGRKVVRIDLAAYNPVDDEIIFVEAENGLWLTHPMVYSALCDKLYVATPYDDTITREEQLKWANEEGIGVIEILYDGYIVESLKPRVRAISREIKNIVKTKLLEKAKRDRKKEEKMLTSYYNFKPYIAKK